MTMSRDRNQEIFWRLALEEHASSSVAIRHFYRAGGLLVHAPASAKLLEFGKLCIVEWLQRAELFCQNQRSAIGV